MFFGMKVKNLNWHQCRNPLIAAIAFLAISGCMTSKPSATQQRSSLDTLVRQADSELTKGKSEPAIALLNQAAKENPTSMIPWLKISNIWFNFANYPSAILAANEVLLRAPENQEARSILVVAGLRVAAGAITGLVIQNPANPGARAEAESLTQALRTALGEKILVPAPPVAEVAPLPPVRYRRKHAHRDAAAAPAPAIKKPAVAADPHPATASNNTSSGGSDPFKSLK